MKLRALARCSCVEPLACKVKGEEGVGVGVGVGGSGENTVKLREGYAEKKVETMKEKTINEKEKEEEEEEEEESALSYRKRCA